MIYGLQGMHSDCPEVRVLLRELPRLVKTCNEPFKAQEVDMMLYGLQGMKSDCPEVITLLRELPCLFKTCSGSPRRKIMMLMTRDQLDQHLHHHRQIACQKDGGR